MQRSLIVLVLLFPALLNAQPVELRIDAARPIHRVDERFAGINLVALWNNSQDDAPSARAVRQMNLRLLRFPGGAPAHWYDWQEPLASGWTRLTPQRVWDFARQADAQIIFQTNTATDKRDTDKKTGRAFRFDSSGTHAAGWVKLAREAGIAVAWWEIGNEPEMDAPEAIRKQNSQQAIYRWYNAKFAEHARAIKAADPKARVMGPAATNVYFWWQLGTLEQFLAAHGNRQGSGLVDAISLHWYPEAGKQPWEQARAAAAGWADAMAFIRRTIARYDTRELPVYLTEWNFAGGMDNPSAADLATALGNADCIGALRNSGVAGHCFFCLHKIERNWGVLADTGEKRPQHFAAPSYYALTLAGLLGPQVLAVQSPLDQRDIAAYAARSTDGRVQILLINKTPRPQALRITLAGLSPRKLQVHTLAGLSGQLTDEQVIFNSVKTPDPAAADLPAPATRPAADLSAIDLPPYSLWLGVVE